MAVVQHAREALFFCKSCHSPTFSSNVIGSPVFESDCSWLERLLSFADHVKRLSLLQAMPRRSGPLSRRKLLIHSVDAMSRTGSQRLNLSHGVLVRTENCIKPREKRCHQEMSSNSPSLERSFQERLKTQVNLSVNLSSSQEASVASSK